MSELDKSGIGAPSTPTIFTDIDTRVKFQSILKRWKFKYPKEYYALINHVQKLKHAINEKGLSNDGTRLWKGAFPARLVYSLTTPYACRRLGLPKNWMEHPKFGEIWLEECRAFCINETSIPAFRTRDRVSEEFDDGEVEILEEMALESDVD